MEVYLVRSENTVLRGNPILGIFTDSDKADEAVDVFKKAEQVRLREVWDGKWKLFSSVFYVQIITTDIPAEVLAAERYKD